MSCAIEAVYIAWRAEIDANGLHKHVPLTDSDAHHYSNLQLRTCYAQNQWYTATATVEVDLATWAAAQAEMEAHLEMLVVARTKKLHTAFLWQITFERNV